ncbi:MAG TPA: alpha-galactosidase [Bryobacteraceae bacterium]|nr:alpha-galactosidase [Bryobacteraceae bacterium]
MTRLLAIPIAFAAALAAMAAQTSGPWTIAEDQDRGTLTITHAKLGVLLRDVRLNVREGSRLRPLGRWTVMPERAGTLVVHTAQPRTAWQFEMGPADLKISSTVADAVITAAAPASGDRIVARLLDPQGTPVDWAGTAEVAAGYGGEETHNPSFLPRRNPECMYFALGRVSSPILHSLFDRQTDTAIQFFDDAVLRRNPRDPDLLDVTLPVEGNTVVRVISDYFTQSLRLPYYARFDDSHVPSAPMVWSSWTSYYEAVREEDMVRNADWLAAHLKPYGFQFVQLDDGYDRGSRGEHYWIEKWDTQKFPHGPKWLADYIRAKGLRAGIWIVPNAYAGAVTEHPDWYLRDKQGKLVLDYSTPALDSSNPEVVKFVQHMFETLDGWGFDYYKFDGEHALPRYIPAVDRTRLYDPHADLLDVYRRRLAAIREILGSQRFIEGCPAGTPLNGIGYFNSYFNGDDLYNNWQGMYPLFSSINGNAFLNHLAVYVMPGEGLELGLPMTVEEATRKRPRSVVETARSRENPMIGFGTTAAEARTLVSYIALTGVAYPLASVMPELPEERVKLLKATMPTMPILPVDLFSRGTDMRWDTFKHVQSDFYIHNYPEIVDLKVSAPAGDYDVVGLTNWRGEKTVRDLDLAGKLGLEPGARYVVLDFWNQRLAGVARDNMQVAIEPHDTRVLLIHRLLDRPQLLGTSRHISGAYSVSNVTWDAATRKLVGQAQTVPGDPYTLWVHVPAGFRVAHLAAAAQGAQLQPEQRLAGELLSVTFAGQSQPVAWEMQFSR